MGVSQAAGVWNATYVLLVWLSYMHRDSESDCSSKYVMVMSRYNLECVKSLYVVAKSVPT